MRFEGAFTNLLNHPNFAPPPTNVTASSFGVPQNRPRRTAETVRGSLACGLNSSNRAYDVLAP